MEYITEYWPVIVPIVGLILSELIALNPKWKSNSIVQILLAVVQALSKKKGLKFIPILACFILLQSCVFTGYGARYETGNYMTVTAKDGSKTFTAVVSVKDEPSALYAVADNIRAMFEGWCK